MKINIEIKEDASQKFIKKEIDLYAAKKKKFK